MLRSNSRSRVVSTPSAVTVRPSCRPSCTDDVKAAVKALLAAKDPLLTPLFGVSDATGDRDAEAHRRANDGFYQQYLAGTLDIDAYVDFATEKAHLQLGKAVALDILEKAVSDAGYKVAKGKSELQSLKPRLWVGGILSALAMIFGMIPLAFAITEGSEQRSPMGQAVIGGVITSSLLTLVVVPVVYCYMDDLAQWLRRKAGFAPSQAPSSPAP